MNDNSRTHNSIRNSLVGVIAQSIGVLLNFFTRFVFVKTLNEEYLGVNGLFSNILVVLSLAELGVGTAIIYSLYLPIAQKNEEEISALLNFYKKAYFLIGLVITVLGVSLVPFLNLLIKDTPDIPNLTAIYLLFLANTSCSYLFAYRRAIFTADQREHILSQIRLWFLIIKTVGQCLILITTRNFLCFLVVQIICTLTENICIHTRAIRYYPFLLKYRHSILPKEKIVKIAADIRALVVYKIGSTALDGTDNIILSMFVGVVWVGKLSNYTIIISSVAAVAAQIMNSITASVGNFIAKESSEKHEELMYNIVYVSFVIYGFSFVCLSCLMTPFIQLVFGKNLVLSFGEVFVCSLNFYIFGMMNAIWTFRTTMGLFIYGRYRPLVSAVINIVISVVLAQYIGLMGVLLGTTITRVLTNVWYDPHIVYKHGFQKSARIYYLKWFGYLAISLITVLLTRTVLMLIPDLGVMTFVLKCVLCASIASISLLVITHRSKEFIAMRHLATNILKNRSV